MQPGSLIFVVIVAIWAAYLIQHWVRRREHAATARSVDRFSEAMRVLDRRSPLPTSDLSTPHPPSYAVGPARPARPAVVVKRSPLVARTSTGRASVAVGGGGGGEALGLSAERRYLPGLWFSARRVRGSAFLVAVGAVPATLLLSALHRLPWVSVALACLALAGVVFWLRSAATKERAARRALGVRRGRVAAEASDADGTPAPAEQGAADAAAPGSWSPVPVPRPTYTMKEPAHRSAPEPSKVALWASSEEPWDQDAQGPAVSADGSTDAARPSAPARTHWRAASG